VCLLTYLGAPVVAVAEAAAPFPENVETQGSRHYQSLQVLQICCCHWLLLLQPSPRTLRCLRC
jgi:hypothetical protein